MIESPALSRRTLLASAAAWTLAPAIAFGRDDAEDREIDAIRDKAKSAGLGEFGVSRNEQYVAIGDAPENFRRKALEILLGLAKDYFKHMTEKGFKVEKPAERMRLLVLSGRRAFTAFLGSDPGSEVGGFYDLEKNHLIIFDNRATNTGPDAERDNTLALFHEATHQLAFNTGLMDRDGDIPRSISEGFACYGEVRSANGRTKFGEVNARRLAGLVDVANGRRVRRTLPSVAQILTDDQRLLDEKTQQVGYSECWLLVHYLMKTPARLPGFREYLKAIRGRKDDSKRIEDWTTHVGDTAKFDRDLAKYLAKLT